MCCKKLAAEGSFHSLQSKGKKTEKKFLTDLNLISIEEKHFIIEWLNLIKDIFLFSCHTGLAYMDVFNLATNTIPQDFDGEKWIYTRRQKTKTASRIPLLPPALAILNKFINYPLANNNSKLLPVPFNQKTNVYLKEIAVCCGIIKELIFPVARHTFATTITLTNGVSIESVSKMLEHKNCK